MGQAIKYARKGSANDMEKGMEFTLRMKDGQTNCVVKGE